MEMVSPLTEEIPSPVSDHTPCDADDLGSLHWDFRTIIINAFLVILVSIILGASTAYFLVFD